MAAVSSSSLDAVTQIKGSKLGCLSISLYSSSLFQEARSWMMNSARIRPLRRIGLLLLIDPLRLSPATLAAIPLRLRRATLRGIDRRYRKNLRGKYTYFLNGLKMLISNPFAHSFANGQGTNEEAPNHVQNER